ncbi:MULTISPECIES: hypothetical protein [unclassified Shewanella]|uniref:hypothetical protein n=1 Tax=unclassified Shewanella TaxID=196818 RepID=UPI000C8426F6|nr:MULTISPECIES: hypothetical protein [unclassified Shewanella]MDO6774365.1 hypothetical protein [Shewanella sp. 3_MG-2023]PMG50143.1 hypothetical protein BCU91_17620 [Shewanella sp. 10N.286.52.B9]
MNLDILYAVTARPPRQVTTPKKEVKKVTDSAVISADSHEAPQTQLPPAPLTRKQLAQTNNTDDANPATNDDTNFKHIDIEI